MREITYRDALKEALSVRRWNEMRGCSSRVRTPSIPLPFARNMGDFAMVDEFKIADRVRRLVLGGIWDLAGAS